MRIVRAIGIVAGLVCLSSASLAFERCDVWLGKPEALRTLLLDNGVYESPVKYFDYARSIRIETGDAPGGLMPQAGHDGAGRPVIFYPAAFPPTLCRIVLATYMEIEGEWRPFAEASRDAARCVDSGRPLDACLVAYGRDLERRYRDSFNALPEAARGLAYGIYLDAAAQIGTHEYAHHLLRHFDRIKSGDIARIDAEFEADFYAMQNGIQSGEVSSAMFYFFKALADVESYSETLRSPDYESGACRAVNVDDTTAVFSIAPMAILDAVIGGRRKLSRNSPELLREIAEDMRREGPAEPSAESCGRLSAVVLREAHQELAALTSLVAEYGDVLFVEDTRSAEGLALDVPRAYELIDRLQSLSRRLVHLKGLATQALSHVTQRVGFAGASAAVANQLDRALEGSTGDILSNDYGRLLKVKALTILYHRPEQPLAARMAEAGPIFEKSVTLRPELAESWINLGFIAFASGRCGDAAEFMAKGAHFSSDDRQRDAAESMRDRLRRFSAERRCAEEAARFSESFTR